MIWISIRRAKREKARAEKARLEALEKERREKERLEREALASADLGETDVEKGYLGDGKFELSDITDAAGVIGDKLGSLISKDDREK